MGYKKTATMKNKEKKKHREPIMRSSSGVPFLGFRTDPDVMRHQLREWAGSKPTMEWGWSPDDIKNYVGAANLLNQNGQRKTKQGQKAAKALIPTTPL